MRNTRVDLLGETVAGELVHIELQSSNDPAMPLRMAEYCLRVFRLFGRFPRQVLVYVGEAPMRMDAVLSGPALQYSYRLVDIRELDGERLLESHSVGDNIVAILTRLSEVRASIRRMLDRIGALQPGEREAALARLLILSELRDLGEAVEQEARNMPILNDILDHKVLGREYKRGSQEEALKLLRNLIEKRFGPVPSSMEQRLTGLTVAEAEALAIRVLDARSLDELLG